MCWIAARWCSFYLRNVSDLLYAIKLFSWHAGDRFTLEYHVQLHVCWYNFLKLFLFGVPLSDCNEMSCPLKICITVYNLSIDFLNKSLLKKRLKVGLYLNRQNRFAILPIYTFKYVKIHGEKYNLSIAFFHSLKNVLKHLKKIIIVNTLIMESQLQYNVY